MPKSIKFKKNDTVKVKMGMNDPDYGYPIEGWQGRIVEIDKDKFITIKWDSESIKNMPLESIKKI